MRQGHDIAIPFGHNQPFDLMVIRKEDARLEKVQVEYTTGDGKIVTVKVESTSAWVRHTYTEEEVDWIAVYDATVDSCFYVYSDVWRGHGKLSLRLVPAANGRKNLSLTPPRSLPMAITSCKPTLAQRQQHNYHSVIRRSSSVVEQFTRNE